MFSQGRVSTSALTTVPYASHAIRVRTGTVVPVWTTIRRSTPLAGAGTSTVPLSISTVSSGSSFRTASPSRLSHSATVPSSIVSPSTGMVTDVATRRAQRSLFTRARAAATKSSTCGNAAVSSTAL